MAVHKVCILMSNCLPMMLHCSQSEDVDTSATETEATSHFFLRCHLSANERQMLRDDIHWINASFKNVNEESLIDVLLNGPDRFNDSKNKQILLHATCYIQSTNLFTIRNLLSS